MNNRRILVIYTGGTIGMMRDVASGSLRPFEFKDVYQHLPMLRLIDADLTFLDMLPLIDSSDINPDFWIRLARLIASKYDCYDGFVILHGTDTMAYTASALSFLLEDLSKPVILTGSQLPLGVMRTDGRENILNSIEIAADFRNGAPRISEVCIYFENCLFRGNRTYKENASRFNAFSSPNYPTLAEVGTDIKYNDAYIHNESPKPLTLHTKMDNNVAIVKLYPGISRHFLRAVFHDAQVRAIVMETYGVGNAPTNPEFIKILSEAVQKGLIIVNVTQCKGGGSVEMGKYLTGKGLVDIGILSGYDLTTEAAVTKLMYLLGQGISSDEVREWIGKPLRGELTV